MNRRTMAEILGYEPSDEQWAAIAAPLDGPLLVLAGAGSGKTSVMSARVLWLVGTGQVGADAVLGVTFTRKAAGELSARVRSLLAKLQSYDPEQGEPTIVTYHAFAMDLLSQFGLLVGAEPTASLLSPTDLAVATYAAVARSRIACEQLGSSQIATARQKIQNLDEQLSEHIVDPETLRQHDERLLQALAAHSGKTADEMATAARRRILASRVVEEVRAARRIDAVVGFADLMRHAVAVSEIPRVRDELRSRFSVVLVDEYQDTSVAQAVLLHNLFGDGFPLTAVGDPLQAIYGWRGASVANIDGFPAKFGARTTTLSINRRSAPLILEAANQVAEPVRLQHPSVRVLQPAGPRKGRVVTGLFDSWHDEATWLVQQVVDQIASGRSPEQIAVLCRVNSYVADIAARLRQAGVPVAAGTLGSLLESPEVVEVVSVLRVLQNADNAALVRLLTGPQWRIGPSDLAELGRRASQLAVGPAGDEPSDFDAELQKAVAQTDPVEVVNLLEAVYDPGHRVSDEARERLRELTAQLDSIRSALAAGVEEAAHRVVEVTGLAVEVRLGPNSQSRLDNVAVLFDLISQYRAAHPDPGVGAFLNWLDRAAEVETIPDAEVPVRGRAVQVMTVHRAKGLEWECVFVPGLSEGVFPSSRGRYSWHTHYEELPYPLRGDRSRLPILPGWRSADDTLEGKLTTAVKELKAQYREQDEWEENRLAYVALTRAADELYATGHWWSKDVKAKEPSAYLRTLRQVAGVDVVAWSEELPPQPQGLLPTDVPWPTEDHVYVDPAPEESAGAELTVAEQDLLEQLDQDIASVIEREREQSRPTRFVDLPPVLSTSMLMRAAADPQRLAADLARPMPRVDSQAALRGTAFHEWVAKAHEQLALIPEWEEAMDADVASDDELAEYIAGYQRTPYAAMSPVATEIEVAVRIGALVVRGVIDAVYRHPDGTWEIVDWKTNQRHDADPLQLAVYRIGWGQRVGVDPEDILAAFVYVRDGQVVRPDLPDPAALESTLRAVKA